MDGSSKTVTYPEIEKISGIVGDSDRDGEITVMDATLIQRFVAKMIDESAIALELCDCDDDGLVTISDTTYIQRYLANYDVSSSNVGKNK